MDNFKTFCLFLAALGKRFDIELAFDENGHCAFPVNAGGIISMDYLPSSQAILLWATIGELPQDEYSGERAKYLLRYQDMGIRSHSFTIGMDPKDRRVIVHDIRSLAEITSEDSLAAWLDDLVDNVGTIRAEIEEQFPYDDDGEDDEEEEVLDDAQ